MQNIATTDEDTPEEIAVFDSLQKGNTEKSSDEAEDFTRVDYDKAATVIQSLLRVKQPLKRLLLPQERKVKVCKMSHFLLLHWESVTLRKRE